MVGKSTHLSRSKAPKTQQICHYRHATKTNGLFLLHSAGVNFSDRNNFANLGSFAKVSVPVQFIILWLARCKFSATLLSPCEVVFST